AVVAEALASEGDESGLPYIQRLREGRPIEADALLAQMRWRQGRYAEAAGLFAQAYAAYRTNPWPLRSTMNRTFLPVGDIAGRDRTLAARLEEALSQPFCLDLAHDERVQTRYKVATYLGSSKLEAVRADLEPNVPWRRALLERRAKLYESTGNRRAALARRELAAFLKHDVAGQAFSLESAGEDTASEAR